MASADISRLLFRATQRYVGTRVQQGPVLLDSCWNEGDDERLDLRRRTIADVVGCAGTPDCGFKLSFCAPHVVIDEGVMYAGGMRFELERPRNLMGQADLLKSPLSELWHRGEIAPGYEPSLPLLVYLEGLEAPVTPIEDRELFDPALGGVDTTVRVRRFARVLFDPRPAASNATCQSLWQRWRDSPPFCPGARLDDDCTLISPVRLAVGFVDDLEAEDECERCEPAFRRGYRLAEPQAIRVMLTRDGKRFAWGFENAAPLYRVKVVGKEVELLTAPRDDFHVPLPGQTVEILSWGALLPNGEKTAEPVGTFTRVAQLDGPRKLVLEDDPTGLVSRVPPLLHGLFPADEQHAIQCDTHLYMRVWLRGPDVASPATSPIVASDGTTVHRLGTTGLTVRFDLDEGAEHGCPGDFWVIAARPEHPSRVVPWTLHDGERPHGPRRAYVPLAVARPLAPVPPVDPTIPPVIVTPTPDPGVGFPDAFVAETAADDDLGFAAPTATPCEEIGVGATAAAEFSCAPPLLLQFIPQTFELDTLAFDFGAATPTGDPVPFVFQDCRPRFSPLTRGSGCCTVTAGRGCQYETLQAAIDALPPAGGRVCIVRGTLFGRTVITARRDIEIVGAGPESVVTVDEAVPGTDPIIDIVDSERVTLRDFSVTARGVPGLRVVRSAGNPTPTATRMRGLVVRTEPSAAVGARVAIAIVDGAGDRIEDCRIAMDGTVIGREPAVYVWGADQLVARNEIATSLADEAIAWGGVQIDGGSTRVRVVGNRIEGGLGHGITLGGVAEIVGAAIPEGGWLLPSLPAASRVPIGSLMLLAGPVLALAVPPATLPLVATPTGHLRRIELRENTIVGMGGSGIAVAGFFDAALPEPLFPHVLVDRLEIVDNAIERNLRRAPSYPALATLGPTSAAAGGIALGAVQQTRIRGNTVRDNGRDVTAPTVGIFVQLGAVEIAGNRIERNGSNLVGVSGPIAGVRAGIALPEVVEAIDLDTFVPLGLPGARIVSNVIRVPEGKALQLSIAATVAILRNEIVARGDNAPFDFPTTYQVTVNALFGAGTGATVDIRSAPSSGRAVDPDLSPVGTAGTGPWGGAVLFEDNQVTLDWPDKETDPACSSVIISARESTVSFLRNQVLTKTRQPLPVPRLPFIDFVVTPANNTPKLVVCPVIVEGFGVQFCDNRLTEGYFEAAISTITRSMVPSFRHVTAQNAATHCIVVMPAGDIDLLNDEMVNGEVTGRFCDTLETFTVNESGPITAYEIE